MTQLRKVAQPFGEVNVYPADGGKLRVVATILMEPHTEGTQTGIAIDGSGSMSDVFGIAPEPEGALGWLGSLLGMNKPRAVNQVAPVAQKITAYLARKLDADGGTTAIYWALGEGGAQVQVLGDFDAEDAEVYPFNPPSDWGTGTQLLPAVRYFVERFSAAPFGFYVFITDGELHDLEAVKTYSVRLAKDVAAKRRAPLKFVLIGVGPHINEQQMEELDDLDSGTSIDLWDHKIAEEMRGLEDIFAEVVDKNARVAERGKIVDPAGHTVKDFSDTGVPAIIEFEIPNSAAYFTLEVNGNRLHQGLSDTATVPAHEIAS
jgi:hypothetical protein